MVTRYCRTQPKKSCINRKSGESQPGPLPQTIWARHCFCLGNIQNAPQKLSETSPFMYKQKNCDTTWDLGNLPDLVGKPYFSPESIFWGCFFKCFLLPFSPLTRVLFKWNSSKPLLLEWSEVSHENFIDFTTKFSEAHLHVIGACKGKQFQNNGIKFWNTWMMMSFIQYKLAWQWKNNHLKMNLGLKT